MTSKLKCPFCGGELDTENYYVHCHNPHCNTTVEMEGTEEMWEALIQAKQDLEIARQALEKYADEDMWENCCKWDIEYMQGLFLEHGYEIAKETLEQIEQKD